MKYQTKLYLSFLILSLTCSILGLLIVYFNTRTSYINEFRSHVMSISGTTAALINPEEFKQATSETAPNPAMYSKIESSLQKVKQGNIRKDIELVNIYILRPSPTNPKQMNILFGVGPSKDNQATNKLYLSSFSSQISDHLKKTYAPAEFVKDNNGTWMSGFSPIYDTNGAYLGTVGVDISSKEVTTELITLVKIAIISLLVSLFIAFLCARFYSKKIAASIKKLVVLTEKIAQNEMQYRIDLPPSDEANEVAEAIYSMCNGLAQRSRLRENFARYVSSNLLEKILSSESTPKLEGERKKITVLVSDIRQFTHMSEKMAPEKVLEFLNEYFEKMIEIIFDHQGALDKFLGDGLIVVFGSLMEDKEQELHAIESAITMQQELSSLCDIWERQGKPRIKIGIGIHTGLAVVGNVGTEKRMEFTVIGDTVLIASILQDATKKLKLPILISESTAAELGSTRPLPPVGTLPIPGRDQVIRIFTVEI